ncbi:unnamed protein product [Rotaria sp. Silwood1]|nr:unnamed protein product [Rotaria sp. Silwood1]
MTMKSKAENIPTGVVVTSLSHSQAVLEPNASITLKMELQVNKAHPTLDNIVNLVFSGATQRSSFKLIMKTSAGWPELDQELLKPLKMLEKNVISQELYDKYVNDYIPLSHIHETIIDILSTRNNPRYETHSYYLPLDKYSDCIFKSYASYGHDNNYTESRYFREGDCVDIILENIHYYPLDINNMNDYREYEYKFGQIPVPMDWSGALFEDRDSILSSLKVGNIVRCQFKKLIINNNKECCGGGAWYFAIIQIIDDTVYGLLKDFYYDPKEYNLNEGDILIFNKDNITEIPHLWSENSNLKDFKTLSTGYFPKGCVCKFDDDPKDNT